jgi:hypothetical protein
LETDRLYSVLQPFYISAGSDFAGAVQTAFQAHRPFNMRCNSALAKSLIKSACVVLIGIYFFIKFLIFPGNLHNSGEKNHALLCSHTGEPSWLREKNATNESAFMREEYTLHHINMETAFIALPILTRKAIFAKINMIYVIFYTKSILNM